MRKKVYTPTQFIYPEPKVMLEINNDIALTAKPLTFLIKRNILHCIEYCGVSVRAFFRLANSEGTTLRRETFMDMETIKSYPSIFWVCAISRLLCIEPHYLLEPNLPQLLITGKVKPKLLKEPPKDKYRLMNNIKQVNI